MVLNTWISTSQSGNTSTISFLLWPLSCTRFLRDVFRVASRRGLSPRGLPRSREFQRTKRRPSCIGQKDARLVREASEVDSYVAGCLSFYERQFRSHFLLQTYYVLRTFDDFFTNRAILNYVSGYLQIPPNTFFITFSILFIFHNLISFRQFLLPFWFFYPYLALEIDDLGNSRILDVVRKL